MVGRVRQASQLQDARQRGVVQWRHAQVPQLRGQRGGGGAGAHDHPQQVQHGGGGVELVGVTADPGEDVPDGGGWEQQPSTVEDRTRG